ncbi:MAG: DUF58 domain-containing protein [Anaerolineae bacterium]
MRRGLALAGLALLAWLAAANSSRPIFYHLAYLLTGLVLLAAFWAWTNVLGLEVQRDLASPRSQVGKILEERLSIRNRSPLTKLWVEVRDDSTLPGHMASQVVTALGPGRRQEWLVRTWCQRRGRFRLGPLTLHSGDPFGIFRVQRQVPGVRYVVVYPATVDLSFFPPLVGEYPGGDATRRRTHHVTPNVAGVRDYVPGDSFNRIHWPSTARTNRLIVKEFELDPTADIWLFLDMDRDAHFSAPWTEAFFAERTGPALLWQRRGELELPPATEEYAVTLAATLARYYLRLGRAVGLVAYAQTREVVQADRGDRQLNKILETLAVITAGGAVPLAQVLAAEGTALGRGVAIVAITADPSTDWVASLRHLRRRSVRTLAVFLAAETFTKAPSSQAAFAELQGSGIPTCFIHRGDDLAAVLSQVRVSPGLLELPRAPLRAR